MTSYLNLEPMILRFEQFQPSCSILIFDVGALSLDL